MSKQKGIPIRISDATNVILSPVQRTNLVNLRQTSIVASSTRLPEYTCDNCDFVATWKEVFENHMKEKHDFTTIYLCQYCKVACKTKGELFLFRFRLRLIVSISLSLDAKFYNFQSRSIRLFYHSKGFYIVLVEGF